MDIGSRLVRKSSSSWLGYLSRNSLLSCCYNCYKSENKFLSEKFEKFQFRFPRWSFCSYFLLFRSLSPSVACRPYKCLSSSFILSLFSSILSFNFNASQFILFTDSALFVCCCEAWFSVCFCFRSSSFALRLCFSHGTESVRLGFFVFHTTHQLVIHTNF